MLRFAHVLALSVVATVCVLPTPSLAVTPEAQAAFDRGKKAIADKRLEDAIDAFSAAIAREPDWRDAYFQRAWVYNELKRPKQAVPDLTEVVRIAPDWAEGWAERSYSYFELKDPKRALADINKAVALAPKSAKFLRTRCRTQTELDPAKALADCSASLEIEPQSALTLEFRGNVYSKLKQWANAIADYETSLRLDPNDVHVPPALAEARSKLYPAAQPAPLPAQAPAVASVPTSDWVAVPGTGWEIDRAEVRSNVQPSRAGVAVKPYASYDLKYVKPNEVSFNTRYSGINPETGRAVVGTLSIRCDVRTYSSNDSRNNWENPIYDASISSSPLAAALAASYCP